MRNGRAMDTSVFHLPDHFKSQEQPDPFVTPLMLPSTRNGRAIDATSFLMDHRQDPKPDLGYLTMYLRALRQAPPRSLPGALGDWRDAQTRDHLPQVRQTPLGGAARHEFVEAAAYPAARTPKY